MSPDVGPITSWAWAEGLDIRSFGAVSGAADSTAIIQAAVNASPNVIIPPGVWNVSATITIPSGGRAIEIMGGATVRAIAGLTGPVFDTPVGTLCRSVSIIGSGIIDCAEIAAQGIWLRYYIGARITGIRVDSALVAGIKLGDTGAAGRSAEAQVSGVNIYRPAPNAIPAASYGILEENSGDALVAGVVVQSYGHGVSACAGSGSMWTNVHAWADPASGVMSSCFIDAGGCTWVQCYADTPSQYGYDVQGFNTVIIGGRVGMNTSGADNVAIGIHYAQAAPVSTVHGVQFTCAVGHRLAKDTDLTVPQATFSSYGCKSTNVAAPFLTTDRQNFVQASSWFQPTGGGHLYSASGAPTISATAGDLYLRTDTPLVANQRLYICTGTTNWTGIL